MTATTQRQFQKCLNSYDKNAIVQHHMADILANKIKEISNNYKSIFELGCGTGYLTKKLIERVDYKKYYANDFVNDTKLYLPEEVLFLPGDMTTINFPESIDLVVSNAALQWIENIEKLTVKIYNCLNPGSYFVFSTFTQNNFKEFSDISSLSLNYKTQDKLRQILVPRYKILDISNYEEVLKFPTAMDLLKHLKKTGVNSINAKPWTVKEIKEFCKKYSEKYPQNQLTYSAIIIVCQKL